MPMLSSEINAASGAAAEFSARPRRRAFTAGDKLRILADVDRAAAVGGSARPCAAKVSTPQPSATGAACATPEPLAH